MHADLPLLAATEADLYTAVEDNLYALFRAMAGELPGGELEESAILSRHHSFPTNPMFKGVWRAHLTSNDADAAIDETIAWFRERSAPFFFWWTGTGDTPADLPQRLQARGLKDMAEQMEALAPGIHQTALGAPCMTADLQQLNEQASETIPAGFTIRPVQSLQALQHFKQVFLASYEIPEWAGQAWVDATERLGFDAAPWRMYVGYLNGEPVATNMLFGGAGVAGLYAVGTIPSVRGQGIGAAITVKPLLDARAMGYRYGALFSTEMGQSVYERVGFRVTGARINRYLWVNG